MQFPAWLHYLTTCPSTNTWALDHRTALHHGTVVYTPAQTAGRGQWGRQWVAPLGVLTASFILRDIPRDRLNYLSLLVGLTLVQQLTAAFPTLDDRLRLKWPNDLWLAERKLAGILCETPSSGGDSSGDNTTVIVGLGLNRAVDFANSHLNDPALRDRAISLHTVVADVPDTMQLLQDFRSGLLKLAEELQALPPGRHLTQQWVRAINQRDLLRDRRVTIAIGTEQVTGLGCGIDWQGGYQLRLDSQQIRTCTTGQILDWH